MDEVKADAVESSFETVERNGDVAALREEVSGLKRRLDQALGAGVQPDDGADRGAARRTGGGEPAARRAPPLHRGRSRRRGFGRHRPRCRRQSEPAEPDGLRSEEHTSEIQSLMRNSYAVFCLQNKTTKNMQTDKTINNRTT